MTAIYALIGKTLAHSFSAKYFKQKFDALNIDADYINYELADISAVRELVATYPNLKGFNVTIPYKELIIPYLDEIDITAAKIQAVNTVKVIRHPDSKPRLVGYNTDIQGFLAGLPENTSRFKQALILGSGGAAKAVCQALKTLNIKANIVSRTPDKGDYTYQQLGSEIIDSHLLIVNCTPLGTFPDIERAPQLPYLLISPRHFVYDLVYNPKETLFLKKCKAQGAQITNGEKMLHSQAEAAWKIWYNT